MPIVRFLTPTLYEPKPDDSPRCWGQLRMRPSMVEKVVESTDGTATMTKLCGPMERYFPAGAKPELSEEQAATYIASGIAEAVDEPEVQFVSTAEIMKDVKVT